MRSEAETKKRSSMVAVVHLFVDVVRRELGGICHGVEAARDGGQRRRSCLDCWLFYLQLLVSATYCS